MMFHIVARCVAISGLASIADMRSNSSDFNYLVGKGERRGRVEAERLQF